VKNLRQARKLPNEAKLIEWRESLRQEFVRQYAAGLRNCWAKPEFHPSTKRCRKFVADWRARHGWNPKSWDILGWSDRVTADQQDLLREAEQACLQCGIDPRSTTLGMSRSYRYFRGGEHQEETSEVPDLGGDSDTKARWPEIEAWLKANRQKCWSVRGVLCEIDGIAASGEPWSIEALNRQPLAALRR
jgi:hypothetical protein